DGRPRDVRRRRAASPGRADDDAARRDRRGELPRAPRAGPRRQVQPSRRAPEVVTRAYDSAHWDDVLESWRETPGTSLLRAYSDETNRRLLAAWLPERCRRLL